MSIAGIAMDWRRQLKINGRRTKFVIGAFITIYLLLGFMVDLYLGEVTTQYSIEKTMQLLLSGQIIPYATLVLGTLAIISILATFSLHDHIILLGSNYHEVKSHGNSTEEEQLYNIVAELTVAAGLRYAPKIYVIAAEQMNAFASGYSEKSALIAITSGLLQKLGRGELQAVIAHELSHIRHQDIKLTLMASVLSNLSLIILDILFRTILFSGQENREKRSQGNPLLPIVMLLRILLPFATMILMLYLSRRREFMADAGAVELTRDNMQLANALLKIKRDHEENQEYYAGVYQNTPHEEVRMAAYLFDPRQAGITMHQAITNAFSTHPSLEARLQALGVTVSKKSP